MKASSRCAVRCALRLAPLVFVRPGELRKAEWAEIDLDAAEWRYTVTKTNTRHIVPLSRGSRPGTGFVGRGAQLKNLGLVLAAYMTIRKGFPSSPGLKTVRKAAAVRRSEFFSF